MRFKETDTINTTAYVLKVPTPSLIYGVDNGNFEFIGKLELGELSDGVLDRQLAFMVKTILLDISEEKRELVLQELRGKIESELFFGSGICEDIEGEWEPWGLDELEEELEQLQEFVAEQSKTLQDKDKYIEQLEGLVETYKYCVKDRGEMMEKVSNKIKEELKELEYYYKYY